MCFLVCLALGVFDLIVDLIDTTIGVICHTKMPGMAVIEGKVSIEEMDQLAV